MDSVVAAQMSDKQNPADSVVAAISLGGTLLCSPSGHQSKAFTSETCRGIGGGGGGSSIFKFCSQIFNNCQHLFNIVCIQANQPPHAY